MKEVERVANDTNTTCAEVSFDIAKIRMHKQMNIQKAFQSNLKAKK